MLIYFVFALISLLSVQTVNAWDWEALVVKKKISSYTELDTNILPYVEKINGLGRKYLHQRPIIIPLSLSAAKSYCPVPKFFCVYATCDSIMIVSKKDAVFAVYVYGRLVRWGPVTSASPWRHTPSGKFTTKTKERHKISSLYHVPMPFAQQIHKNIFIHQGPIVGKRASHGCVRLLKEDAEWLFYWTPLNFKVDITEFGIIDSTYINYLSKI